MTEIDKSKKVEVYFNLHKKCWSIRQAGKPVVHSDFVEIKEPQFVVQQGGNARVRREKRKNVHAFVRGFWCDPKEQWSERLAFGYDEVTYNPYKYDSFVLVNTGGEPVNRAKFVDMAIGNCAGAEVMVQFTA